VTAAPAQTILVIEDTPAIGRALRAALEARGYRAVVATTGQQGIDAAATNDPAAIILDLGLPDMDGTEVCTRIRSWSDVPIIVLTVDDSEYRKVETLDIGADDYVTKPFSMPELMARLRVALRHRELVAAVIDPAVTRVGDVVVDTGARTVVADGRPVELTRKEFGLLEVLARNPGKVVTHGAILGRVWGAEAGSSETLRVHVTSLRKKLGEGADRPRIQADPGVGYRLVLPDADGS
jgi:two-component system, OmpR family, KDP operon response regulator KdpE